LGREDIFKLTVGNESLHQDINENGIRILNFAKSKDLIVKSTMFAHRKILKCTWTSPDGKTHNHTGHTLIDRRWHSVYWMYEVPAELNVKLITIW